jgi:hypothetical protein
MCLDVLVVEVLPAFSIGHVKQSRVERAQDHPKASVLPAQAHHRRNSFNLA